jgi:hypothetical protein
MTQLYELAITAAGEVRDADGNLVSSSPVETRITVTDAQLRELGLTPPEGCSP